MHKTIYTSLTNYSHKAKQKNCFRSICNDRSQDNPNLQFHSDCNNYFESLREKGETDFEFEDEYFFTIPAISQMSLD